MGKLCVIYNSAAHYRESIFMLMDQTYDIDWYFGTLKDSSIKQMDISKLKNSKRYKTYHLGRFNWIPGLVKLLFKKNYIQYVAFGDTQNLSLMLILFLNKILFINKKIYLWTHGFYGKETKSQRLLKKWLFGLAEGNFTYGQHAKNLMVEAGLKEDMIWPIHNSLNYEAQSSVRNTLSPSTIYIKHFGNEDPVLIFIGRLTPVKRLDTIIDAMNILSKRGENFNLVLIGEGPEKDRIVKRTEEFGLTNKLWLYGACYDETKNAELIYNADLCVAPGNIGLTAMHVLAFGTPACTHNNFAWQMPEFEAIKEGKTGFFFNYLDVNSMADGISKWFKFKKNREEIRKDCIQEMDENWNANYQIKVLKQHIIL